MQQQKSVVEQQLKTHRVTVLRLPHPQFVAESKLVTIGAEVLGPLLAIGTVFFLLRVVLSWFPAVRLDEALGRRLNNLFNFAKL